VDASIYVVLLFNRGEMRKEESERRGNERKVVVW
jgi:hypothetical protein